ncbi:hypothetical protein ES704_01974 [subsurface metagenome]
MKKRIWTVLLTLVLVAILAFTVVGCAGEQGLKGLKGDTGAQGIQGEQGEPGLTGVKGSAGATGATGVAGVAGEQGIQGEQGLPGATGATGATGAQGVAGIDGTFPYTIQMGTYSFNVDETFTGGYHKQEQAITFDPSFGSIPLVFVTATSGVRTNTIYALWDVAAIDATTDGFTIKIGSDMEKVSATVTVNWLAISQ